MNTCETCRFHHDTERDNWSGECRRRAPGLILPKVTGVWPRTRRTDWCGDFSPAETIAPADERKSPPGRGERPECPVEFSGLPPYDPDPRQ